MPGHRCLRGETPPGKQTLKFANGDQLFGSLVSMNRSDASPLAGTRMRRNPSSRASNVMSIELAKRSPSDRDQWFPLQWSNWANADSFEGDLVLLDEKSLTLDTVFAAVSSFPADSCGQSVRHPRGSHPFMRAPPGWMAGPKARSSEWRNRTRASGNTTAEFFYASRSASIARTSSSRRGAHRFRRRLARIAQPRGGALH